MLKKAVLAKIVDKAKDHIIEEYKDETISYIQSEELKVELATKMGQKWDKNGQKMDKKWTKNEPKMNQK